MDKEFRHKQILAVANNLSFYFQSYWSIYEKIGWVPLSDVEDILEQFHRDKLVREFGDLYRINILTLIKYEIRSSLWQKR